jgi:hypothetical protein
VHSSQESAFAVLTPYLIPRALREKKVVNLGDGFILRAIERLIGRFAPARVFSSRVAPSDDAVKILEQCRGVILAGANQLKDSYTIWPGLTAECILKGALRFVPFGMGLHGQPSQNQGLSAETRAILQAVHARIEYSSWRCPRTVALLRRELPHLAGQFLMTGCPVLYDEPILESARFQTSEASVAVTATERNNFWDQETGVIDMVARRFPHARRYFVTHQNSSPPGAFEGVRHRLTHRSPSLLPDRVEALRLYARRRGFRIVIPRDAETCLRFYEGVDIHVGSRLHAHLLFLSRNKRSYLVPIDERAVGMAEHFGFPAGPPEHIEAIWECDFEVVRERARATFAVMDQFVRSVVKQP